MQVLSWDQRRKKLLRHLAELDAAVARRAPQVMSAWEEISQELAPATLPSPAAPTNGLSKGELDVLPEYSTAEDVLFQPKPPLSADITASLDDDCGDMTAPVGEPMPPATPATKPKSIASYLD